MQTFGLVELHDRFPFAYRGLPEPYQNDSCLEFYEDCNGNLIARATEDQKPILGEEEWMWMPLSMTWASIG